MLLGRWNGHGTTSAQPRHRPAIIPAPPSQAPPSQALPPNNHRQAARRRGPATKGRRGRCATISLPVVASGLAGSPLGDGSEQACADGRLPWPGPFGDQRRCPFPPPSPSTVFQGKRAAARWQPTDQGGPKRSGRLKRRPFLPARASRLGARSPPLSDFSAPFLLAKLIPYKLQAFL